MGLSPDSAQIRIGRYVLSELEEKGEKHIVDVEKLRESVGIKAEGSNLWALIKRSFGDCLIVGGGGVSLGDGIGIQDLKEYLEILEKAAGSVERRRY